MQSAYAEIKHRELPLAIPRPPWLGNALTRRASSI